MALTQLYRNALRLALGANPSNWPSDSIFAALLTTAYTPAMDADDFWNDVSANELAAGSGYTANGVAVASKTLTYTAANSWATQWAASTAQLVGAIVRPTTGNGFVYRAQAAGTTAASEPTWPTTIGATVTDSGVTWTCVGRGVVVFGCANPSWAAITFTTVRYLVFVNRTPSTDATRPLLFLVDFGSAQSIAGGTFSFAVNAQGLYAIPVP